MIASATTAVVSLGLAVSAPVANAENVGVTNPGFTNSGSGWEVTGAARVEPQWGRGGSADPRANAYSAVPYSAQFEQELTGLEKGWYTLRVWAKSGSATPGASLDASSIALQGCGLDDRQTIPSTEQSGTGWVQVAVSAYVSDGSCTLQLKTEDAVGGAWADFDDVTFTPGRIEKAVRGVDVSTLLKNENFDASYRDASGVERDALSILADNGANYARLKVWVNPTLGYNDQAHVVEMAKRAKALGMKVLIDFHYSYTWADPGKQFVPREWQGYNFEQTKQAIYEHTSSVLRALKEAGAGADMVQVGNEINPGILTANGYRDHLNGDWSIEGLKPPQASGAANSTSWPNLAAYLTSGAQAVRDVSPDAKIMLHLTNINRGLNSITGWYDQAVSRGVPFDVIGLSYYQYWHGNLSNLQGVLTGLAQRYPDKKFSVVETAYGFTTAQNDHESNIFNQTMANITKYPATPAGQASNLRAIQNIVANVPDGRGLGVFYWEPAWTAVPRPDGQPVQGAGWDPDDPRTGNGWENQAVFGYDNQVLPAAEEFAADTYTVSAKASLDVTGEQGSNGWYTGPATATAGNPLPFGSTSLTVDGVEATSPAALSDDGTHEVSARIVLNGELGPEVTATVPVDATVPEASANVDPSSGNVTVTATDSTSGIDAIEVQIGSGDWLPYTGPVTVEQGSSLAYRATDKAGNVATGSFTTPVLFTWGGFREPINPGVLNTANAGRTIPVKFVLAGDQGLDILATGSPTVRAVTCNTGEALEGTADPAASTAGLRYDAESQQYIYNWKTNKSWTGSCRELTVTLTDGSAHSATFQFTK